MHETDLVAAAARVEQVFGDIAATRMVGVPVVNPALGVSLRGLRPHGGELVGVLVTPWFMNLVFLPLQPEQTTRRIGTTGARRLPSGLFDTVWNHEDALGGFWSASLFSPMFEFADMAGAIETADAIVEMVFGEGEEMADADVREAACVAHVQPAAPIEVEQRLAQEEARVIAAQEAAAAAEEAQPLEQAAPARLDRRALFGLRREAGAAP